MAKIREIYLHNLELKMKKVENNRGVNRYVDATCIHPILFINGNKYSLVYYSDVGLQKIAITKFKYENRVFKAFVDGEDYYAITINTTRLSDSNGQRVSTI